VDYIIELHVILAAGIDNIEYTDTKEAKSEISPFRNR